MKTVYIATAYGNIDKKEIVRETEQSIFYLNGRGKEERSSKKTTHSQVFDTHKEAINYIILEASIKVEQAKRNLDYYENALSILKQKYKDA